MEKSGLNMDISWRSLNQKMPSTKRAYFDYVKLELKCSSGTPERFRRHAGSTAEDPGKVAAV